MTIVEKIHKEIDEAEQHLIDDMLNQLNVSSNSQLERKATKLEQLGFVNNETVRVYKEISKRTIATTNQLLLMNKYRQSYPFNKILTLSELERICEKYKLIYAPAAQYIKDIPEKNVNEMHSTKPIVNGDHEEDVITLVGIKDMALINRIGKSQPSFTQSEINIIMEEHYGHNPSEWTYKAQNNTWLFAIGRKLGLDESKYYNYRSVQIQNKTGIFIAAPQSHFNLEGATKKGKFGFFQVFQQEVKDPIAFEHLKGGMVRILSKWGTDDDQSYLDPSLVNEIEN